MNHEEAWELLSDYVDGSLLGRTRTRLEAHLEVCESCRREVDELRALLREAGSLPHHIEPHRDLWPAIADRTIAADRAAGESALDRFLWAVRSWRGFWPLAVATAASVVVVVGLSLRPERGPEPFPVGDGVAGGGTPDAAAGAVIEALEAECGQTDWEMAEYASQDEGEETNPILGLIVHNLRIIDQSISELREAWKADPASPRLARMLAAAYRAKIALQGQAARVANQT